jgi:hypothetical protein
MSTRWRSQLPYWPTSRMFVPLPRFTRDAGRMPARRAGAPCARCYTRALALGAPAIRSARMLEPRQKIFPTLPEALEFFAHGGDDSLRSRRLGQRDADATAGFRCSGSARLWRRSATATRGGAGARRFRARTARRFRFPSGGFATARSGTAPAGGGWGLGGHMRNSQTAVRRKRASSVKNKIAPAPLRHRLSRTRAVESP